MLRKLLQKIFSKPVARFAAGISSSPRKDNVFNSLSQLYYDIINDKDEKGVIVPFELNSGKFIILSDQHKGGGDIADDFARAENNYVTALEFYFENGYSFINLGDCEELWETSPNTVVEKNRLALLQEAKFLQKERYYRIFGNHDLEWKYSIQQNLYLKPLFGEKLKVFEGLILRTVYNESEFHLFFTHGHQGDLKSDGNRFSKWAVAAIWTPIQRFLEISLDSVSDDFELVDKHNIMMYEWSATKENLLLVSGHTHKPVFVSLDHIDRLAKQLEKATLEKNVQAVQSLNAQIEKRKSEYAGKKIVKTMAHPSYFNTGCCCFNDGDISGLEIENGFIRLIKWEDKDNISTRRVLEESPLFYIFDRLQE